MEGEFRNEGIEYRSLVIAKNDDGEVIGAAAQYCWLHCAGFTAHKDYGRDEYNVVVYVKPEYRRKGVGKKMIQKLKTRTKAVLLGSPHGDDSHKFFKESGA